MAQLYRKAAAMMPATCTSVPMSVPFRPNTPSATRQGAIQKLAPARWILAPARPVDHTSCCTNLALAQHLFVISLSIVLIFGLASFLITACIHVFVAQLNILT